MLFVLVPFNCARPPAQEIALMAHSYFKCLVYFYITMVHCLALEC